MLHLPRSTPESHGVDPAAIESFIRAADAQAVALHSLMVVRHGDVVAEGWWKPYRPDLRHMMFSVSKSFAATAVGLAAAEGLLSIDEPILSIFPTYASSAIRDNAGTMTLRHALAMATGHEVDTMEIMRAAPNADWLDVFLSAPVVYPPGEHFLYNSGASYVLAAAVTSRAGQNLVDYLRPRLFEPLGIDTPPWVESPRGIALGASGLRLYTEDLAKLGLLYLRGGDWNGQRILTQEWVDTATSLQVLNENAAPDWSAGYGFQFWRSTHASYRADGAYGQFSFVLPEQDAVVAITAGVKENWRIPALLWEHLLPAFGTESVERPGSGDSLTATLGALELSAPEFLRTPPRIASTVSGRRIELPFNTLGVTAATLHLDGDDIRLELEARGASEQLPASREKWAPSTTLLWPYDEYIGETATASRGGWIDERTFEIHQQCVETPFRRLWTFAFDADGGLDLTIRMDLALWTERSETLHAELPEVAAQETL